MQDIFHFSLFHFSLLTFGRPLSRLCKAHASMALLSLLHRFTFYTHSPKSVALVEPVILTRTISPI